MYQVMVVDDEPMAASLIVNIIKRKYSDFEIMGTSYDGEEALELMEEKGEPDVLITDIQMPVMNGLKLVEETKKRYPEVIMRIAEAEHEIRHHGYAHERFAGKTTEEQIEIIEKTQRIFKDLIGHEVTGFRTPSGDWAKITPQLLYERGFRYSSSMRGDDRPYRTVINGEKTDFIEIPTKWEVDDYVAMAYNMYPAEPAGQDRISSYRLVEDNFMREFCGHYREGLCISYMSHPQVIGSPGRIQILKHMLEQITSKEDVWVATGTEVSDWYRSHSQEQEEK